MATEAPLIQPGWLPLAANPIETPGWQSFTGVVMDTFVTIAVRGPGDAAPKIQHAFDWFRAVEKTCSRFDLDSELSRLRPGEPTGVSALLFELVRFSVQLAELTGGAFDPTIGAALEAAGFRREYLSGREVQRTAPPIESSSYRDIVLNSKKKTIRLRRPVVLDLGAVAKGLAIDLAARELRAFSAGCVDAGGDLRVWGDSPTGGAWSIGIQHPDVPDRTITTLRVHSGAVCTSGGYERPAELGAGHHLLTKGSAPPDAPRSVTVIAPTALSADGLSTAAFLLGARQGLRLAAEQGVEALFVQPDLSILTTSNLAEYASE